MRRALFLLAYTCSGLAGLVYEVGWTRLLTLYMGHTTAATSTVVAAFMGGLAGGALLGGRFAPKLTPRQCLRAYIVIEAIVAVIAIVLPFELAAMKPLLAWAYRDGAPGLLFPAVRLIACLTLICIPALGLGATFPLAVRWFVGDSRAEQLGRFGGALYALNTAGAAVGAIAAGFVLIPAIGVSGTTWVGVAAGVVAIAAVSAITFNEINGQDERGPQTADAKPQPSTTTAAVPDRAGGQSHRANARSKKSSSAKASVSRIAAAESSWNPFVAGAGDAAQNQMWMAALVLAFTGFASLTFEIAWTRVLALTLGPTTYAFATTVAALIAGLAFGSGIGAWLAGRVRRPGAWLAVVLAATAVAASLACARAGSDLPLRIAQQVASEPDTFQRMLTRSALAGATLVFPASLGFGAAFPLALALLAGTRAAAKDVGFVYALNTVAAVTGSLVTGFLLIPMLGLQQTLRLVTALLVAAALIVTFWGALSMRARGVGLVASLLALVMFAISPPWDQELLASGVYKYSAYVAKGLDLLPALKAGELLYYKEGAAATVSVKRLTGTTTLAIDGKVDASNGSDMLTQKLIAHLPLLLHERPGKVCIIGMGSGVTLEAALRHPVSAVDVVEISPEVVEASKLFATENRNALDDPRTRLIVGDGRSHLALTRQQYDVIISEPSNPWIAGVASLFTREFFVSARERLAPGGIIAQWAHTYNISSEDLRSIAATFISVFPRGTIWMVGQDDVLLVAGNEPIDERVGNVDSAWTRPGVAEDLTSVGAHTPFEVVSLFAGGPDELRTYSNGAPLQTDDRMGLEFSGPRAMDNRDASENAGQLSRLFDLDLAPARVRLAREQASSKDWRERAAMLMKADVPGPAYDDYLRAVAVDPTDTIALEGLANTAVLAGRVPEALERIAAIATTRPTVAMWVAKSRLVASTGDGAGAIDAAREATLIKPLQPAALEQLAAIYEATSDASQLDVAVQKLKQLAPDAAATHHYAAVLHMLRSEFAEASAEGAAAIKADPQFAAAYDVVGAAQLKLGHVDEARKAFVASLGFNPHDSTAYTNLGILELQAGSRETASRYFAEALWLDPESKPAKQGLAQASGN